MAAQPSYLERPRVLFLDVVAVERGVGTGQAEGQCPLTRVGRYCPGPEEYYQGEDKGQDYRKCERDRKASCSGQSIVCFP